MANMNQTTRGTNGFAKDAHTTLNHEGAIVHRLHNTLEELFSRANGAYLGENGFYEKNSPEEEFKTICTLVDSLSPEDAEYALKIAAIARENNMVSTPLAILTACFNAEAFKGEQFADINGRSKFFGYTNKIVRRGKDITDVLAFQLNGFGRKRPLPKQLRKQLKASMERFNEFQLSKALGKSRSVSLADAVKLIRPSNKSEFFKAVIEGNAKFGNGTTQMQTVLANKEATSEEIYKALINSSLLAIVKNLVSMNKRGLLTNEKIGRAHV